jgi:hypothetical protein
MCFSRGFSSRACSSAPRQLGPELAAAAVGLEHLDAVDQVTFLPAQAGGDAADLVRPGPCQGLQEGARPPLLDGVEGAAQVLRAAAHPEEGGGEADAGGHEQRMGRPPGEFAFFRPRHVGAEVVEQGGRQGVGVGRPPGIRDLAPAGGSLEQVPPGVQT